jgi:long-chain acyl-CoA synthetase
VFEQGKKMGKKFLGKRVQGRYEWVCAVVYAFMVVEHLRQATGHALTRVDDVHVQLKHFGSGLTRIPFYEKQCMLGIFMRSCPAWVVADLAALHYSMITVALYETWPLDMLVAAIHATQLSTIVVSDKTLYTVFKAAKDCPSLKTIIVHGEVEGSDRYRAKSLDLTLYTFPEIVAMGKEHPAEFSLPAQDDLARVCFKSGHSSNVRGVAYTHQALVAVAGGVFSGFPANLRPNSLDRHLSYLPLAHVYEHTLLVFCMMAGCSFGFFGGDTKKLRQDAMLAQPTILSAHAP